MIPESKHGPSCFSQNSINSSISRSIPFYFLDPELPIAFKGPLSFYSPTIAMPERTIAKHSHPLAWESNIGFSLYSKVQLIAKSCPMQRTPQSELDLTILSSHPRHVVADLLGRSGSSLARFFDQDHVASTVR